MTKIRRASLQHCIAALLLLLPMALSAQNQLISTSRATVTTLIQVAANQLEVLSSPQIQGTLIKSVSPSLNHDDLSIKIDLLQGKGEDEYQISIQARLDGKTINIREEDLLGDFQQKIQAAVGGQQEIIWTGLLDRYYDFSGKLELIVSVELWGKPTLPFGVDCDKMPVFGTKQKLPYYLAAGVGVVSVGLSIVVGAEAQKIYDDNYLAQNFEQAAEPFYQDANDKRHTSLILRYGGIAVLAADAALYFYRKNRHKKRLATYHEFCDKANITISPVYEQTSIALAGTQLGFKFSYRL